MNCPNCGTKLRKHGNTLGCDMCGLICSINGNVIYDPRDKNKPIIGEPR